MDTSDILMSVGLDITDATQSAKNLKSVLGTTFDATQKKVVSQLESIGKIQDALNKLYDKQQKGIITKEELANIDQLEFNFQKALDVFARFTGELNSQSVTPFQPLIDNIVHLDSLMEGLSDRSREILNNIAHNSLDIAIPYRDLTVELGNTTEAAATLGDALNNIGNDTEISGMEKLFAKLDSSVASLSERFKSLRNKIASTVTEALNLVGSKVMSGVKKLGKIVIKELVPGFKHTSSSLRNATSMLKKFILAGIGVRSIYFLFRKFWNMVKGGVNIMAKVDSATNTALSNIKTATYSLQKQFGSLFSNLVQAVAPAIVTIINLLTKAITLATQFFAALTGKSTYKRATTQVQDYAASLDKSSKSAKKAKDENKKYLSGLDEIARWEDKSKDDTSGGGGAGDLAGAFEDVPIDNKIFDFVNKLKDLFKKGEWYKLGYEAAEALANGLDKLYDLIKWDKIKDKVTAVCTAITETINGFIGNKHFWTSLGKVVGAAINDIIQTLYLLVTGVNWDELGAGLGRAIGNVFAEIDWETFGSLVAQKILILPRIIVNTIMNLPVTTIAESIKTFFISLFDGISAWLDEVDWEAVGKKIQMFLDQLFGDGKLKKSLGNLIKKLFQSAFDLLKELNPSTIISALGILFAVVFGPKLLTLLGGLITSLIGKAIGWAVTSLGSLLIAFGGTIIKYLIWGILKSMSGLLTVLKSIPSLISGLADKILGVFSSLANSLGVSMGAAFGGILALIVGVITAVRGFVDAFTNGANLVNGAMAVIGTAIAGVGLALLGIISWPAVLIAALVALGVWIVTWLTQNWDTVNNWIENAKVKVQTFFTGIVDKIKEFLSNIQNWLNTHFGVFGKIISQLIELVKIKVETIVNVVKNLIVGLLDIIRNILNVVVSVVKGVIALIKGDTDSAKEHFINALKSLVNVAVGLGNTLIGVFESIINGVIKAINVLLGGISKVASEVGNLIGLGSVNLTLSTVSLPRIPKLAQGAVIPANQPFLAMLGEQRQGTNVEAPLETIKQAVAEVIGSSGKGGDYRFTALINRRTLFDEFITEAKLRQSASGRNPLEF